MKTIFELEKSDDILDRQEYANRLKGYISKWEAETPEVEKLHQRYPDLESFNPKRHKEGIKKLKIKLSEYSVYNQTMKTKCSTCKETECVCYTITSEITKEELNTLF